MRSNKISQWNLEDYEIGIYLPKHGSTSRSSFKLLIPKLNPFQNSSETPCKKPTKEFVNSSIFINSRECKVTPSRTIDMINYFEVPVRPGDVFEHEHLKHGDKLRIEVRSGDIYQMYVTSELDPSHEAVESCPPLTD
jgi:hypothetical protein